MLGLLLGMTGAAAIYFVVLFVIVVSSVLLVWHFTFSIVGFIATGRSVFRGR